MTDSPPWPRLGGPDRWTHVVVRLEHDASDESNSTVAFEIWARYPTVVIREYVDGQLARDVRANVGISAALDVERSLCLAKTGQDPDHAYNAAIAIAAGPVAELYGARSLDGWRQESVGNAVAYHNDRRGPLRQATIDAETGLPLEADTVDGRWRWVIQVVGDDPPSVAPDVTDWAKESHERTELLADAGPVEHIRYRSSSLRQPLEFIAFGEGESSARVVIARDGGYEGEHLTLPDGRTATVLAGEPEVVRRLVEQVVELLGGDQPDAAEDADQWNKRVNALVGSIAGHGEVVGGVS